VCASCTAGVDCASGSCAIEDGAASGYCTQACVTAADCPAGLDCARRNDGTRSCAPTTTCAEYLSSFGQVCVRDNQCSSALASPSCAEVLTLVGYCTAACSTDEDCLVAGYGCEPVGGQQKLCLRTP
jgi:hypothetical protein